LRPGTSTGAISASNRPEAWAWEILELQCDKNCRGFMVPVRPDKANQVHRTHERGCERHPFFPEVDDAIVVRPRIHAEKMAMALDPACM
jgi:hypothetical protein